MSLADLRAKAELEDEPIDEVVEDELEDEAVDDDESDAEPDETEELDDFDLELEGEPDPTPSKPTAEQALVHKLMKAKAKTKALESEKDDEIAKLRAQLEQRSEPAKQEPKANQHGYPPVPILYENGINTPEQYVQAYQGWMDERARIDRQVSGADEARQLQAKQTQDKALKLATEASVFIKSNKIKPDLVIDAIDNAKAEIDEAIGFDGAFVDMIDSLGEGGAAVGYYLGRNKEALNKLKDLLKEDPRGLKAISHMTKIAGKLKPKSRSLSGAPEPDQSLKGDGGTVSAGRLQQLYDKASEKSDLKVMRELTTKAKAAGVKLT